MMTTHLRAGAARIEITPRDLTGLNSFGDGFTDVHDPLFLRAVAFNDGESQAVIIAADLVEVGDTTDIRARLETLTGIPASRVLIAPSHSHNSPRIGLVTPGGKARIPTPESLVFTDAVYDAMVTVLQQALARMEPARVGFGRGTVDVNISRDAYIDGRWTLGYNPDAPSDKTLSVVTVESLEGRRIAVLMNYAVHSTVTLGLPDLGADLAGAASTHLENTVDDECVALWLSGALGDQAPRIQLGQPSDDIDRDRASAHGAAHAQGLLIAETAIRIANQSLRTESTPALSGQERVIALPARRLPIPPGMEQADVETVDLTLTVLTVGTIAFAGISGEVTVPVAHAIADAAPLSHVLIISNVNARIGYLPADEAYDRHTQAADGCPIVQGHGQATMVREIADILGASTRIR